MQKNKSTKSPNNKGKPNGKPVTKKQVEQMIRGEQEIKFLDVVNSISISYGGTVVSLSDLGQGSTNITRIGNKITPRSLQWRMTLTCADSYNIVRFIVFRWNQRFSLDPPDTSDILQLVNSTNAVNAPYTFDERAAFKIIHDETITMVLSTSRNTFYVQGDLRLKQKEIDYFGSSTTDVMNGYYCMFISDSSVTTHPAANYYFRLQYADS